MQPLPPILRAPLRLQQYLLLASAPAPGDEKHVNAASGIAFVRGEAIVVSDNLTASIHLNRSKRKKRKPGWVAVTRQGFSGKPIADKEERIKSKPDLEAVLRLPKSTALPNGALVALGSGSRDGRTRALVMTINGVQAAQRTASPRILDMAALYANMKLALGEQPNIEGATVAGDKVLLFHRGNGETSGGSAIVAVSRSAFESYVLGTTDLPPPLVNTTRVDLGMLDGVKLTFSDACTLPDGRIVFTASAEGSSTAVSDGRVRGSVVGLMDANFKVLKMMRAPGSPKIEGVDVDWTASPPQLMFVTDADDDKIPSQLLAMPLSVLTTIRPPQ